MAPQNSRIIHVEKKEGAAVSCGGKVIFRNKGDGDGDDQGLNSIHFRIFTKKFTDMFKIC